MTGKELIQMDLANEPHYVIHVGTGWRSIRYATQALAQAWIDGYGVTQNYKDANYRVVNAKEYETRHMPQRRTA